MQIVCICVLLFCTVSSIKYGRRVYSQTGIPPCNKRRALGNSTAEHSATSESTFLEVVCAVVILSMYRPQAYLSWVPRGYLYIIIVCCMYTILFPRLVSQTGKKAVSSQTSCSPSSGRLLAPCSSMSSLQLPRTGRLFGTGTRNKATTSMF